ncbi:MAG: nucleotidyltransferase [Planctomycetes bacterium]|nr:nucleotidyltransferase [Planctomycetota bacterium]
MHIEKDYEELLKLLNRHKVRYCVVGAFAVAFYSRPRYTKDMDILVEPSSANARKVIRALKDFGFKRLPMDETELAKPGQIVQLGYEPVRVDIITSIEGCEFGQVWKNRATGRYGKQKIYFIGLKELLKNKKALNRPQDKMDLDNLSKDR